jgi:hypothetical protein
VEHKLGDVGLIADWEGGGQRQTGLLPLTKTDSKEKDMDLISKIVWTHGSDLKAEIIIVPLKNGHNLNT